MTDAKTFKTTVQHVDTCLPGYVQDHCNGEDELLLGVAVDRSTRYHEVRDGLVSELNSADFGKELPADAKAAIKAAFADVHPLKVFDSSLEPAEAYQDGESCYAWFRLSWDPADVEQEQREANERKARAAGYRVAALADGRFATLNPAGEIAAKCWTVEANAWFEASQEAEKASIRAARLANKLPREPFFDPVPVLTGAERNRIDLERVNWSRIAQKPVALVILPGQWDATLREVEDKGVTIAKRDDDGGLFGCREASGEHMPEIIAAWIRDAEENGLAIDDRTARD